MKQRIKPSTSYIVGSVTLKVSIPTRPKRKLKNQRATLICSQSVKHVLARHIMGVALSEKCGLCLELRAAMNGAV
jgi:hypothetical protein